jgi:hypothetical protein
VDIAPDFDSIVGAVVGDKPTGVRMINRLRARLQEITDSGHDWSSMIVALRSKYPTQFAKFTLLSQDAITVLRTRWACINLPHISR